MGMHDAWECQLDLAPPERAKAASWRCWGTVTDERGRGWAKVGVEHATCTLDINTGTLIARIPEKDFLCVAEALHPGMDKEAIEWHHVPPAKTCKVLQCAIRDGAPDMAAMKLVYIRLASAGRQSIPRLILTTGTDVLLSDDGEWRRQLFY